MPSMDINLADFPDLDELNVMLARQRFIDFVTYTMDTYSVNWHHAAIAEQLDKFAKGEIKKMMLFVPPQHGKSQLSSRHLPAYLLGRNPNCRVAICSYSDDLAGGFAKAAQRIMDSEEYQKVFPETKIPKKGSQGEYARNADLCQVIDKTGYMLSLGVGNGITGKSVDMAIIDDPIKGRADAESDSYRKRLQDWYVDELLTRLNNKSQILILLTRWHEDDLAGWLLKKDEQRVKQGLDPEWTVVTYPAIKEADYTAPGDPREPGEALWEEMHSAERILEQKLKSERTYNSLYQQRPSTPDGNLFKTSEFSVISMAEFTDRMKNRKLAWDFYVDGAYTEKTSNDETGIYCSASWNNNVYIRKSIGVRMEFPDLCEYLPKFVKDHGYQRSRSTIYVEPKASGISIVQSLKRTTKLNVKKYKWPICDGERLDDKDKVTRANSLAPSINSGRIILIEDGTGWTKTFLEQVAAFPNSKADDQVDNMMMDTARRFFGGGKSQINKEQ